MSASSGDGSRARPSESEDGSRSLHLVRCRYEAELCISVLRLTRSSDVATGAARSGVEELQSPVLLMYRASNLD